jgi:cob(I)alamin adenosyltransferase
MKGYVQVYTGDGKGKTTAAFGLAMRAYGAGLKIYIAQFVKGMKYSELDAFQKLEDRINIQQWGRDCFIINNPTEEDIRMAQTALQAIRKILRSGEYDVVILDEVNIATFYNLISVDELLDLIENKPDHVEIIITGRKADPRIIERADLVTEMQEVKHYYQKGIQAREGIEK